MTTAWKVLGETQDGQYGPDTPDGWDLDAIGRRYDAAKADIADPAGPSAPQEGNDPWPETEAIDVQATKPPAPRRRSSDEQTAGHRPDDPVDLGRPWRALRRWFARHAGTEL